MTYNVFSGDVKPYSINQSIGPNVRSHYAGHIVLHGDPATPYRKRHSNGATPPPVWTGVHAESGLDRTASDAGVATGVPRRSSVMAGLNRGATASRRRGDILWQSSIHQQAVDKLNTNM